MLGNDVRKEILKLFKTEDFIKLLLKMEMLGKFIFYCVIFIKMEERYMNFIDAKHKKFEESIKLGKADVYYKSIIYILGICEETRKNFEKIFNISSGEINIDSIQSAFQTGTSSKVTRMAFSLWNGCNFGSERDIEDQKISLKYNINEIFSCGYAPYFYEGIKIRFPEYTRETNLERIGR